MKILCQQTTRLRRRYSSEDCPYFDLQAMHALLGDQSPTGERSVIKMGR